MVLASAATKEFQDPIIYADHPDVSALLAEKKRIGSSYDYTNNSAIYHTMPEWITSEEKEKEGTNLLKLTQIISSYFDTVHAQIESLSQLRDVTYGTGSFKKPLPFSNKLLESVGLVAPEILILDEATSSIDSESEMLIQRATARITKGRTALIVAHRLSTIREADRIIVLDHGKVVQQGSHEDLIGVEGIYSDLNRLQFQKPNH